jgi:hypothetical protein
VKDRSRRYLVAVSREALGRIGYRLSILLLGFDR